jgi:alpha-tubulin suppressor-like RCC1 family protein
MNLARVRFLRLCALPLSLSLFAACNAPIDESGDAAEANVGVAAQALISARTIAGGNFGSLAAKSDGTVWAWGLNSNGQLGDGTTIDRTAPVQVSGLSDVLSVSAAESNYSLALKSNGTVFAWGWNGYGVLGDGTSTERHTPVQVSGLSGATAVSAAYAHSLALKSDGTVWAWGLNNNGQIGDGTSTERHTPVQVSGLSGVTAVSAQFGHSLALKSDGTVWAWGRNSDGELGDGTTTNRLTPVQVSGLSDVTVIAAGQYYSLALKSDGTVWTWGSNGHGELGDGTTTQRLTPVQVGGLSGVTITAVASAYESSLALTSGGTVMAWGLNGHGQLGDGTTTNRTAPVQVHGINNAGMLSGVTAVAAGDRHSLAQKSDGTVLAWGANYKGQLGDGTTTERHTPVLSPLPCMAACEPQDQCHVAVCDPTGFCESPNKADGAACSDGNACTQTDTCQAGACTGASPVTCTAQDQCHAAGACDQGTGTCSNPNKADGAACSDGNACTQTDTCQSGACIGASPVTCTAPDPCHPAGICDPGTGTCSTLLCQ